MDFVFILLFALVIFVSCLLFAFFGKNWDLKPFIALSAGGLLTISFLEFMPHSFEGMKHSEVVSGFILLGVLLQILSELYLIPRLTFLDNLIEKDHNHQDHHPHAHHHSHLLSTSTVCSAVGCLAICSFFDGIRLFAGFTLQGSAAIIIMISLFFHLLSEGVLVALMGLASNMKRQVILVLAAFISGALILGALCSKLFLSYFAPNYLMALATGTILYVCFVHLLPFAIKGKNKYWFLLGLGIFSSFHFIFH